VKRHLERAGTGGEVDVEWHRRPLSR
jgi:hypothetical protein